MLHCHQFTHHPSVRPAKLSSLFSNSSNSQSCLLHQLNANINDAVCSEGAQYWNGKRNRCIRRRIGRHFQASSVATALQAYDMQEQIRKINFHEQVEFFNLFQHHSKYFPNATNSRKRTRNSFDTADKNLRKDNVLDDLSIAQISEMIRKTEKERIEKLRAETESVESVQTAQTTADYVHASLFGPQYSAKIVDVKPTHKRRHSAPSSTTDKQTSYMNSSAGFFSHFPSESLSLVGVGGFGRVYRIQSNENAFNDQRLAVKIIPFNSSKTEENQEKSKESAGKKYGAPILAAAAMLAAVHAEEEQQRALEESSTERQVLREVSVLSALSSPNTARYRWAWVENWSDEFDQLFNAKTTRMQRRSVSSPSASASASRSTSASFSDTSDEWNSGATSIAQSIAADVSDSDPTAGQRESVIANTNAGSSKPKYDSVLVLLMDYYDGISLSEFISNPSAHLPECLAHTSVLSSLFRLYLSYQILTSLEYLHAHQCIHRDLAPKNLIVEIDRSLLSSSVCNAVDERRMDALLIRLMSNQVRADDLQESDEWKAICAILAAFNVRLIDFGLSRHFGKSAKKSNTQDDAANDKNMEFSVGVGTRSYAPPEQLQHVSSCKCKESASCNFCSFADRGDIFSCGLLMAEMLCAPFQTQMERIDFLSRMRDRRWNQVEAFQALPKMLKELVCSMISPAASGRPSAGEAKKSKAFTAVRRLIPFIAATRYEHCAA